MRAWVLLLPLWVGSVAAAEIELPLRVQAAMNVRQLPYESLSVHVKDLESGEIVLAFDEHASRNPGSTIKLLTTLVALDVLGPTYRWSTDIHLLGELADGRLDGDLLIKGHGDPFLVTERVWQMLRALRQSGIQEIAGDLLIDDSYFEVSE
ncbi:MAG: D-alanyl-D-alanine carboxypeptidase, partial [Gammaproteobacteria bacterium]|nr:D-alanyl-D-alanine carboxypeptidase [Gammaproteobacteria bacterium]